VVNPCNMSEFDIVSLLTKICIGSMLKGTLRILHSLKLDGIGFIQGRWKGDDLEAQ
jgi:hypothetical protein